MATIAQNISRIQTAKADLKTAIEAKGVTVPSATTIDGYATLVGQIQTGGGGSSSDFAALIDRSITSVEIPSSVTSIGQNAFYGCTSLTSVEIPSSVTSIGQNAFYGCTSLTSVEIPSSVTSIGDGAFGNDTSLASVYIYATTPPTLYGNAFRANASGRKIYVPAASVNDYKSAIYWSTYASYIEAIPIIVVAKFDVPSTSSATNIMGSSATSQFSEIEIDGVVQPSVVSSYTFDTTGEHTVRYICNNYYFSSSTFYGCLDMTEIVIPNDITSLGSQDFVGCTKLAKVTLSENITSISQRAFQNCSSLTSIGPVGSGASVEIPSGVTSIGDYAFYGCTGLTNINIPSGVTSIGNYAFQNCSGLTSVTIPNSVTYFGSSAFQSCTDLTSINIPSSVTNIQTSAFRSCTGLTSVEIPSSVTTIGGTAFYGCSGLISVTVQATTPPTLGNNAFYNNASGRKFYVPAASVNDYKSASGWSTYASYIEAIPNS